ncbi:MAG: hypothetical protein K6A82_06775 [Prevotella sp.]|nr:hypothetical protein [Prevotella sp.]
MQIYVIQKKLGSRKELGRHPVTLTRQSPTLSVLLQDLTFLGLTAAQAHPGITALEEEEIATQATEGRIKFADRYGKNRDTLDKAMQRTQQAFDDGLFRVFINGEEITSWDAAINMTEGDEVVFLRLTMLTGLYFFF